MCYLLECIGATSVFIVLLLVSLYLFNRLYHHYLGHMLGFTVDPKSFGGWCVITGSTDGIGKAYAFAMAKKRIDLILISRSQDKLNKTEDEIKEKYNIDIKTIAVDFSEERTIYDKVKKGLDGVDVGIMINNVGTDQWPAPFSEVPDLEDVIFKIYNVNVISNKMMNSIVLPKMVTRKKGLILNVSSLSSVTPLPGFNVYGSSKVAIDYHSRTLSMEYKERGVIVQSVIPGYVATKMSRQRPSLMAPTPEQYVNSQLRSIGLGERSYGYFFHTVLADVMKAIEFFLPENVRYSIMVSSTKKLIMKYKKLAEEGKKD